MILGVKGKGFKNQNRANNNFGNPRSFRMYNCGKKGHFIREYRYKNKEKKDDNSNGMTMQVQSKVKLERQL